MTGLICFSSTHWNFLWQRPQQLMTLLSQDYKVAFINPPRDVCKNSLLINNPDACCKHLNSNLMVCTPPKPANLSGPKVKTYLTDFMKRIISHNGFKDIILWFNMPEAGYLCGNLGEKLVVYDCLDDFESFSWTPKYLTGADHILTERADLIIVVSESLYKSKIKYNSNCFLIPNGCDYEHFHKTVATDLRIPDDIKKIPGPHIGFAGALFEWVDLELINYLAGSEKAWSIVLIGPRQPGFAKLEAANIYYLGTKKYSLLPNYLQAFDICMVPFKISRTTISSSPIKLYEYLASGKPVVSTLIPESVKFAGAVEVAGDYPEFKDKIRYLLQEPEDRKISRKQFQLSLAHTQTWESRCRSIRKLLQR